MTKRSITVFSAAAAITVGLGTVTAVAVASSNEQGAATVAAAKPRKPAKRSDFNGDGHIDLVSASPAGWISGKKWAGFVTVVYGSRSGPNSATRQVLTHDSPGIPGTVRAEGSFGGAVASADFDRDGYADLAVDAGDDRAIVIVYGGRRGLTARTVTLQLPKFPQNTYGHTESLAVGDFDRNGRPDILATLQESSGMAPHLQGFITFANPAARPVTGIMTPVKPENGTIAHQLAPVVADFTGDGYADLALVVGQWDKWGATSGRLELRLGSRSGLGAAKVLEKNWAISGDLAAGDVNGDGKADLAALRQGWKASRPGLGLHFGTSKGLGPAKVITRKTPGVPGEDGTFAFGDSVALGDVNGDRKADVAVGQTEMGPRGGGAVTVLRGTRTGFTTKGVQVITQDTRGVPGSSESGDAFGSDVSFAYMNGDGRADLTIGDSGENNNDGWLYFFPGSGSGVTVKGLRSFGPPALGIGKRSAKLGENLLP